MRVFKPCRLTRVAGLLISLAALDAARAVEPEMFVRSATLKAPTVAAGDHFGAAVTVVPALGIKVVGAPFHDGAATGEDDAGLALVFDPSSSLPFASLESHNAGVRFGTSAASMLGGRLFVATSILVGAPLDAAPQAGGAAYLYSSLSNYQIIASFAAPAPTAGDFFGSVVAFAGGGSSLL